MDAFTLLRAALALVFVLGLIAAAAWAARRYGAARLAGLARGAEARLKVVEVRGIDARHKLVLVRHDNREHLLLLGPGRATVVDRGTTAATAALPPDRPA
jgi:flagellar protein FliO/FliZ